MISRRGIYIDIPTKRVSGGAISKLDKQCMLSDIGWHTLQLEGLETRPSEQRSMSRCKFAKTLYDVFVDANAH